MLTGSVMFWLVTSHTQSQYEPTSVSKNCSSYSAIRDPNLVLTLHWEQTWDSSSGCEAGCGERKLIQEFYRCQILVWKSHHRLIQNQHWGVPCRGLTQSTVIRGQTTCRRSHRCYSEDFDCTRISNSSVMERRLESVSNSTTIHCKHLQTCLMFFCWWTTQAMSIHLNMIHSDFLFSFSQLVLFQQQANLSSMMDFSTVFNLVQHTTNLLTESHNCL